MEPEFPATLNHLKYHKWSHWHSTVPLILTTSICMKRSSMDNVKIQMAAKSRAHSSYPTNTPTTRPFKICTARVMKSHHSHWHTKMIQTTGPMAHMMIGSPKWPVLVWFWSVLLTLRTVQWSVFGHHTCVSVVTNNSKWWPINFSSMMLQSPLHWDVFQFGHTHCTSACHTSVTETLTTVHHVRIQFGKWSWMNWIVVMIQTSMNRCQVVTWSTHAQTFKPVNNSHVFCITISIGKASYNCIILPNFHFRCQLHTHSKSTESNFTAITIPTVLHLVCISVLHGWNQRKNSARNWPNSSMKCWAKMMSSSLPCCKPSNGCRIQLKWMHCVISKTGKVTVLRSPFESFSVRNQHAHSSSVSLADKCDVKGQPYCSLPNACPLTTRELPGETLRLFTCMECPNNYPWILVSNS